MKTYFLLLFLLVHFISNSQTLTEQAGGITTDFIIYSAADKLNVLDQTIIKRGLSKAEKKYDDYSENSYGYGYGYGLQTFRLEFSTTDYIRIREKTGRKTKYYELIFFDENDERLLKTKVYMGSVQRFWNEEDLYIYSFNLQSIPLVILNSTHRVKITFIESS